MANYDFQNLSSFDFELLSRDLLQCELKVRLETFGKGKDGGIDFRFKDAGSTLVVQCKHYADYGELRRVLKRDELPKVRRLKPKRYILTVSTSLTPTRKDEIVELFAPYCLGPQDIYGRGDLNNLLTRFPEIETGNFKLWLTSEAVLTRFLNAGVWKDAELTLSRIRNRVCRCVINPSFERAKDVLEKKRSCIIAGIPGIGKTTLAEVLLIDYVDRHGYEAIRIANDLSEIKSVKNQRRKQIFYYDDFLGTKALDRLQKNEEHRLLDLMEEVSVNSNWRFVLTTREYILNAARMQYEVLANPPIDLQPCIIALGDYTAPIRAKILYNHIFFSDLPTPYKRALLEGQKYKEILSHRNYNPRIIEHMTTARHATNYVVTDYGRKFIENLSNPVRIWDHAFRYQLSEAARHLLLVMGTLPDEVRVDDLEKAFDAFYQTRREKYGFSTTTGDFERSLKELDGNFVQTSMIGRDQTIKFHNPSVGDFIDSYLYQSSTDVLDLIRSAVFFDQFSQMWQGNRNKRFPAVSENSSDFIRDFRRCFLSPMAGVTRWGDGSGAVIGASPKTFSFEARLKLAVEIAEGLPGKDSDALISDLTNEFRNRVKNKRADKSSLVHFLKDLTISKTHSKVANDLVRPSKDYLLENLDDLEDFRSIGQFAKNFPGSLSEGELQFVQNAFLTTCRDYDTSWAVQPEEIESIASDMDSIGELLSVDIEMHRDSLLQEAADLASERGNREPDYGYDPEDWKTNIKGEENTDLMFENLLREIVEKA